MNKILVSGVLGLASVSALANDIHWDYSGENGPDKWAQLAPEFAGCAGKNQSPVNLARFMDAELPPVAFNYHAGGHEVTNNGHTVQVNYVDGSHIRLDGIDFILKQFHFHAPSENTIHAKSFPMEAHFVHVDKNANVAVVAVMFQQGEKNKALESIWRVRPRDVGKTVTLSSYFSAEKLFPGRREYYRFNGSLTTPPCSEGVRWLVLKQAVSASEEQIAAFERVMGHANNRPVQPVNARTLLE